MGKLKPQDLSFADTAPFTGGASAVMPVPASAVFTVLKDHQHWPDWVGAGVTSVEPTSDPDYGVGSTRKVTFMRLAKVEELFVGWEEPTLWAFTGTSFRPKIFTKLVERFVVEPVGEQSARVTYSVGADFPWLLRPIGRFLIGRLGRAAEPALKRMGQEAAKRHDGPPESAPALC
jgi:hypothetical protein